MFTVKISVLKNQLSKILHRVRKGEEAVILDRDRPVARISAIASTSELDAPFLLKELEKRGVIRPAAKKPPSAEWLRERLVSVKAGIEPSQIIIQEREESW